MVDFLRTEKDLATTSFLLSLSYSPSEYSLSGKHSNPAFHLHVMKLISFP